MPANTQVDSAARPGAGAPGAIVALDDSVLETLRERARFVIEEAARQGATAAEVGISAGEGLSVTVRLGEVETLEFNRDRGVSVTVYAGQRKGTASSSDDAPDSLRETVAAALAIAQQTGLDEHNGLAPPEWLATEVPDLDLYHPWTLTPEQAIAEAQACEAAGRRDPRIINSEGATVGSHVSARVYANSHGFIGGWRGSHHSRSCVLVAEQDGAMQRDYWYDTQRDASRLATPEAIGARAAERTLARLGATRLDTGEMPVLFAPEVAKGLIGHFISAISGGALYRNASFLRDRIDSQVFPEWVTISERPHLRGGSASAPFDTDGIATRDQDFVRQGVLSQYALGLYAARRLARTPTGNGGGVRNLTISHGAEDQAALCRRMGHGVLITEVMGQGVNLVSGDYSRGASGFRVENGEIAGPVEEFTIAGHLGDMFAGLQAAGCDVDERGNIHCGSLLLSPMKIAGV
ncbi:metalloprotease PmbA [Alcanivorax sp. JB21]|uniref:metalloprotease PmbA n=1 Tax=Alcanivorax limicola TaxID=2874102 RepID=UPI001CC1BC2F|nr:metalloprotease PmbA [Alcanivorax limicola]MBZ2189611.1 metalloprotease PmbA [Alcanivorax limicola]